MKKVILSGISLVMVFGMTGCLGTLGQSLQNGIPGGTSIVNKVNSETIPHWKEAINVTDSDVEYLDFLKSGKTLFVKGKIFKVQDGTSLMFKDAEEHHMSNFLISGLDKETRKDMSKSQFEAVVLEVKAIKKGKSTAENPTGGLNKYTVIKLHK